MYSALPRRAALLLCAIATLMLLACSGNGGESVPRLLFSSGQAFYSVRADGSYLLQTTSLTGVTGAVLSPDGQLLAFPCRADQAPSGPQTDVCLITSDGFKRRVPTQGKLPPSSTAGSEIAWSPDSRMLAFVANLYADQAFTSVGEVYVLNVDDEQIRVLVPGTPGTQLSTIRWSPDGRYLAALGTTASPKTAFEVVDVQEGARLDLSQKTGQDSIRDFAWSPDSSALAFLHTVWRSPFLSGISGIEVYSVAVDGSNLHKYPDLGDWPLSVVWAPDGRWLAVTAAPVSGGLPRIYVVPTDGSEPHPVAPSLVLSNYPSWSPDGRYLVFAGAESAPDPNTYPTLALYVADAQGAEPRQLAPGIQRFPLVAWSPDGRRVFFTSQDSPCAGGCPPGFLFSAPTDGSAPPVQLTDFVVDRLLGWQP